MNIIAFDYGTKKIGVASGNSLTGRGSALTSLKAKDGIPNWDQIESILGEWKPDIVVIGLPLNMDGSESDLSKRARKFANRIHGRFGVKVDLQDERLTSNEAKSIAREQGHRGNFEERPIDELAAVLIAESYLATIR